VWLPVTVNNWPLAVIVPALAGVLSPQFIIALKLVGVAAASLSVKVATVALKGLPATALMLTGVAVITVAYAGVEIVRSANEHRNKHERVSIEPPTPASSISIADTRYHSR
jgi:hypothetical protein